MERKYQLKRTIIQRSLACYPVLWAVSRKPRKVFGPVKILQNLEPCDYRAVLFTYSKDEERFASYKKFQALRARKRSGAFDKRALLTSFHFLEWSTENIV